MITEWIRTFSGLVIKHWVAVLPVKMSGHRKCVFQDSVNEFLEIAGDYDGFVFGTPVHWAGATGAMTSFMDRVFMRIWMAAAATSGWNRQRPWSRPEELEPQQPGTRWISISVSCRCPLSLHSIGTWHTGPARKTCGRIWRDCRPCEPLGTIWHFSLTARTWDWKWDWNCRKKRAVYERIL